MITIAPLPLVEASLNKATSYPMHNYLTYKKLSSSHVDFLDKISTSVEPKSFSEASKNPLWVQAMNEDLAVLELNQTRDIANIPEDRKIIGSRWVYK